jgi:hypothetical protein
MNVARVILERDLCKKSFEIGTNIGVGVLLNKQRGGGVAAENRQKTAGDILPPNPGRNLCRELSETFAMSLNLEAMECLTHWNNQGFEGFQAGTLNEIGKSKIYAPRHPTNKPVARAISVRAYVPAFNSQVWDRSDRPTLI